MKITKVQNHIQDWFELESKQNTKESLYSIFTFPYS